LSEGNSNGNNKNEKKKESKEYDKDNDKYKDRMVMTLGAGVVTKDENKEKSEKESKVTYPCQVCGANFPTYQSYSDHFRVTHQ
jgi:ribosomal protein L44E